MTDFISFTGSTFSKIVECLVGLSWGTTNLGYILIAVTVIGMVVLRLLRYR